jgi:hypothetical protein
MHHDLKAHPDSFELISQRKSSAQIRRNDRGYKVGDTCSFYEWIPKFGIYGGSVIQNVKIVTILDSHEGLTLGWSLIVLDIPKTNITRFCVELAGKTELPKAAESEETGKQTE